MAVGRSPRLAPLPHRGYANHHARSRLPSRPQPFPSRNRKTRVGRRSEIAPVRPSKCHQDLTVLWRSLRAAADAMAPFNRGVSDLGCGRGHDRRRGQISWSLTPRYCDWPPCRRRGIVAGGTERRPTRSFTSRTADGSWNEASGRAAGLTSIVTRSELDERRGNTSRGPLFPLLFPLSIHCRARCVEITGLHRTTTDAIGTRYRTAISSPIRGATVDAFTLRS
jgi:hypothetical protein